MSLCSALGSSSYRSHNIVLDIGFAKGAQIAVNIMKFKCTLQKTVNSIVRNNTKQKEKVERQMQTDRKRGHKVTERIREATSCISESFFLQIFIFKCKSLVIKLRQNNICIFNMGQFNNNNMHYVLSKLLFLYIYNDTWTQGLTSETSDGKYFPMALRENPFTRQHTHANNYKKKSNTVYNSGDVASIGKLLKCCYLRMVGGYFMRS